MKKREEKFTRRGTPDKHTSNIFLCISCSESCAQPLHVKSSLIISKQLSHGSGGCTKAQAGFHPIHLNFSPVFLVATACTTEEDDVQARDAKERKSYWRSPLFLPSSWICERSAQYPLKESMSTCCSQSVYNAYSTG